MKFTIYECSIYRRRLVHLRGLRRRKIKSIKGRGIAMETLLRAKPKSQDARYEPDQPLTRGVHHLALNTEDMKKTIEFYVDVLGMPLIHAMKVPPGLGKGQGNRGNPPTRKFGIIFSIWGTTP